MKHKAFTLVELAVVVAILGILAAILWPTINRSPHYGGNARVSSCQSNLKQIGLAFFQYAQDYDDELPPLAVAASGYWAGSLQPYSKSWQIYQCPSDVKGDKPATTDYFNARLAEAKKQDISFPRHTLLLGEGTGNQLPLYHLRQLPDAWRQDSKSPAQRHLGVANYAFADGHVKYLKPEKITLDKPAAGAPTFLVREGKS